MAKERFEIAFGSGDLFPENRKRITEFVENTIEEFVRHGEVPFTVEVIISTRPTPDKPTERKSR